MRETAGARNAEREIAALECGILDEISVTVWVTLGNFPQGFISVPAPSLSRSLGPLDLSRFSLGDR